MSERPSELNEVDIHQSLIKPMMFMGGERTPMLLWMFGCIYTAFILTFRFKIYIGLGVAIPLWLFGSFILRSWAKKDPQGWTVWGRSMKYKDYYPARGRFNAFQPRYHDFKK